MRRFNVVTLSFAAVVVAALASSAPLFAGTLIVPKTFDVGNGNSAPFAISAGNTMRYQQVYGASDFTTGFGGVPRTITAIIFRPDSTASPFSGSIANIQIDLSTTSAAPDALSTTFANNVGADDTVVYSGALTLTSNAVDISGPNRGKQFDISIPLATPFTYDPSKGNLLLDVRNFSGGQTQAFGSSGAVDTVSRLYSSNVNGATGSGDTVGLDTMFSGPGITPEPAGALTLVMGASAMFTRIRRPKRPGR